MTEEKKKPVKTYKAGALSLSLWENEVKVKEKDTKIQSFTFQRSYKDDKDEWQHTQNLRIQDLPKFKVLIDQAYREQIISE